MRKLSSAAQGQCWMRIDNEYLEKLLAKNSGFEVLVSFKEFRIRQFRVLSLNWKSIPYIDEIIKPPCYVFEHVP